MENGRIIENQWCKGRKGKIVYKYHRDFFERLDGESRITYQPSTGVAVLIYNFQTDYPVNGMATKKVLGGLLKNHFNADRYICVVQDGRKTKGMDLFTSSVEFYFRADSIPQGAEGVPSLIEGNLIQREFEGTDSKTGDKENFNYIELLDVFGYNARFRITQECECPKKNSRTNQRCTIMGYYWQYAK